MICWEIKATKRRTLYPNIISRWNKRHLKAMKTRLWCVRLDRGGAAVPKRCSYLKNILIGIIITITLSCLSIDMHPQSMIGVSAHVPSFPSPSSFSEETTPINRALVGGVQRQRKKMRKIKVLTKKYVRHETILSNIDTGRSGDGNCQIGQISCDNGDSLGSEWDLDDDDFEKLLADLAEDSVEEIEETFEYDDYEIESDNEFDFTYLVTAISPTSLYVPMETDLLSPICGLYQSQQSVGKDDASMGEKSGYYDQFGYLDQSVYEEEYYTYDSTSYDIDSPKEEIPKFAHNFAGTLFTDDSLDEQGHPPKPEWAEDTNTEGVKDSNLLKTTEEGVERLDSDELLLLVEASDIIDSNLASEDVITDYDEYLGDDELRLLEEACAFEPCWFSGDEYDGSGSDQSETSEAPIFYEDITANVVSNRQIKLGGKGAENLPNEFIDASDQLHTSTCEQLPSPSQILVEGASPPTKDRHQNTKFSTGSNLSPPTPLVPKNDVSNTIHKPYDREIYSLSTSPPPPPTSLSENVPESSARTSQDMDVKDSTNHYHLRRADISPFLVRPPPPGSGEKVPAEDQSKPSNNPRATTLSCRTYTPPPPPPPPPLAFVNNNRPIISMAGFVSSTSQKTQIHAIKTRKIVPINIGSEKSRAYGHRDFPTTSDQPHKNTHIVQPPSNTFGKELQAEDMRTSAFLPPPPPPLDVSTKELPREGSQIFANQPPPPPPNVP